MPKARKVEAAARALYETAPGTNGYAPLHESIPWREVSFKESFRQRAAAVVAAIEAAESTKEQR